MSSFDIRSNLEVRNHIFAIVAADGVTTASASLDNADAADGVMFAMYLPVYGDGSYSMVIEESDQPATDFTAITDANMIIGASPVVVAAASAAGDVAATVGVISNKRYLRAVVTASGLGAAGATVVVQATQMPEILPVS